MNLAKLKEGDVIYTDCIGSQLCYHLGIIYQKGNTKYVFHNAPTNSNKFGGTIIYEKLDEFMKGRMITKAFRTRVTNKDILRVAHKCKREVWDSLFFNCEDFVVEIVEGERRSDLRDVWKIGALGLALISIY
jgi:hypothetical protein